jgi:hypothetical protein
MVAIRVASNGARLPDLLAEYQKEADQVVQSAVRDATQGMLQDFRTNLRQAFPGSKRAPNLVTSRVFPERSVSINAAGSVVGRGGKGSAWPLPLRAFNVGTTITGRAQGASLAIPTARVPFAGRRKMTPLEVERSFGEKLTFIPSKQGERGAGMLVLQQQTIGRSGKVRGATAGRARQGRKAKPIVMFILVPKVRLGKRLDFDSIAWKWAGLMPSLPDQAASRIMQGGRR